MQKEWILPNGGVALRWACLYVICKMLYVKLYIVYVIYQASFYHEKVGVMLFLLTKMLIFIVFNMLGVF